MNQVPNHRLVEGRVEEVAVECAREAGMGVCKVPKQCVLNYPPSLAYPSPLHPKPQAVWTGTCGFNQHCRAVGADAVAAPDSPGLESPSDPLVTDIGSSPMRPRTGSVDLAVGVGVGMFIGGAAVFIVLITIRKRRSQSWGGDGRNGAGLSSDRMMLLADDNTNLAAVAGGGDSNRGRERGWRAAARRQQKAGGGFLSRRGKGSSSVWTRRAGLMNLASDAEGDGKGDQQEEERVTGSVGRRSRGETQAGRLEQDDEEGGVELQHATGQRQQHMRGSSGGSWEGDTEELQLTTPPRRFIQVPGTVPGRRIQELPVFHQDGESSSDGASADEEDVAGGEVSGRGAQEESSSSQALLLDLGDNEGDAC